MEEVRTVTRSVIDWQTGLVTHDIQVTAGRVSQLERMTEKEADLMARAEQRAGKGAIWGNADVIASVEASAAEDLPVGVTVRVAIAEPAQ